MFQVLNFGSLNIDHVYQVRHFVTPGETLSSESYLRNAGGKGLNQSVALARAGVKTAHAGKIGKDGIFLREVLEHAGVDTSGVIVGDIPTGHACIQVEPSGQNSILLYPGANRMLTEQEITGILDHLPAEWLLLQNEINHIPFLMKEAKRRGMKIAINPAPCDPEICRAPLDLADLLFVNEVEAAQLAGEDGEPVRIIKKLTVRFPGAEIVMTLGKAGALYAFRETQHMEDALPVKAVDTTCAGDTFNGFFLAGRLEGRNAADSMKLAAKAASITVSRPGAACSIPYRREL